MYYVYIYCLKEAPRVVVRALVEAGADVNAANDQEDTPLSFAIVSWIYVFFTPWYPIKFILMKLTYQTMKHRIYDSTW